MVTEPFYLKQDEPNKSCLLALRSIILASNEDINESLKWNMPCFSFKKKMLCFLWTDKKTNEPYILFVEGKSLEHPRLEQGTRTRMKILRINPNADIPMKLIKLCIETSISLNKSKH